LLVVEVYKKKSYLAMGGKCERGTGGIEVGGQVMAVAIGLLRGATPVNLRRDVTPAVIRSATILRHLIIEA
jgi:hypothetical protein